MDASANAGIGAGRNAYAFVIGGDESSQTFIVHTEDERYNWMLEVASQLTQRDAPVALPNGMTLRPRSSFITSQTVAAALAAGPLSSRTASMDAQAFDAAMPSAAATATIQSARRGVVSMSALPPPSVRGPRSSALGAKQLLPGCMQTCTTLLGT